MSEPDSAGSARRAVAIKAAAAAAVGAVAAVSVWGLPNPFPRRPPPRTSPSLAVPPHYTRVGLPPNEAWVGASSITTTDDGLRAVSADGARSVSITFTTLAPRDPFVSRSQAVRVTAFERQGETWVATATTGNDAWAIRCDVPTGQESWCTETMEGWRVEL